ncbi:MAG: conjugative transposon protein TraM [Pedobacter sp.]|nr:MAG: conjugative transposon protein TraM [Pedobacter sp.]
MRNIDFKQPKYILPLLILPFLLFFFFIYRTTGAKPDESNKKESNGMQGNIGQASEEVRKSGFSDKLDAFRNQYKDADGNTAINPIQDEATLDSIDKMMQNRFAGGNDYRPSLPYAGVGAGKNISPGIMSTQDQQLARALAGLNQPLPVQSYPEVRQKEKDPMEIFKAQMAYMDSLSKATDPELQQQRERDAHAQKVLELKKQEIKLPVSKLSSNNDVFNTLIPGRKEGYITAIIDENITGYAGSRIRLRLLEDINVGSTLVKKGTYLYAEINGFSGQRVTLNVKSILTEGRILPVKLDLYDTDGLEGLYVPQSAFRDFTRDLGGNSVQGVNIQGTAQNQSQFLMSTVDKMVQSTSSAIASLIRKNKAKIKYSSFLYLIDPEQLQDQQKKY